MILFGDGDDAEIFVLDDFQSTRAINYHKMQGRPSVEITLQEKTTDTSARINAMSKNIFDVLEGTEFRESGEVLRCANNSLLQIMRRTTLSVRISQVTKMVEFTVVKEMSPGVIGGIEFQEQLGFKLMQIADDKRDSNIEGKFGRTTNNEGCERTFSEMKEELTRTPVLEFPDVNKKFILDRCQF